MSARKKVINRPAPRPASETGSDDDSEGDGLVFEKPDGTRVMHMQSSNRLSLQRDEDDKAKKAKKGLKDKVGHVAQGILADSTCR